MPANLLREESYLRKLIETRKNDQETSWEPGSSLREVSSLRKLPERRNISQEVSWEPGSFLRKLPGGLVVQALSYRGVHVMNSRQSFPFGQIH